MNSKIVVLSDPEKVDMADDWYQYATLDHFWIKGRFRAVMQHESMKALGDIKMLEIGCGNGLIIKQFEETLKVVIDGSDLNMFALEQIAVTNGTLYCLNIYDKPKELLNQYDGIVLMDVIEHIESDAEFLKAGIGYLRAGGLVIINVPALNSLFSKYDIAAGHKRRYNKQMIRRLFNHCQIEEVSIRYWGFALLPIALLRNITLQFVEKKRIISTGFNPPNKVVNWILDKILYFESIIFKSPPSGTSIVAVGKYKTANKVLNEKTCP